MGREAKRVPLDFDHPINEIWPGYLLPESLEEESCADCDRQGCTTARLWLTAMTSQILLLSDDLRNQQQGRDMHPYFRDSATHGYGTRPTQDILELTTGLAGREPSFIGHDSIDTMRATQKIVQAAGLDPKTWGICSTCEGHGSTEKYAGQRDDAENWEPEDPPTGDGYQLWSTTTEGHPVSPVFATPEELARHLADTNTSLFGSQGASYDRWINIIKGDDMGETHIAPGIIAF